MFLSLKGIDTYLNSLPVLNTVNSLIQASARLQWQASITESKAAEASSFKRNFQILVLNKSAGDLFVDALPLIGNIVALVKVIMALISGFENDLEKAVAQNNRDVVLLCLENGDLDTSPNPEETLKNAALLLDNKTFQGILNKGKWSADNLFNALNRENLPAENVNSIFEYRDFSQEKLESPTVLLSFLKTLPNETFHDFIRPLMIHKTPGKLLALIKGGIATEHFRLIRTIFLNALKDVEISKVLYPFIKALPDAAFKDFIRPFLIKKNPHRLLALIKGGIATEHFRLIATIFLNAPKDVGISAVLHPFIKGLPDKTFPAFIRLLLIHKNPDRLLALMKGGIATQDLRLIATIFLNAPTDVEISAVLYPFIKGLPDKTFHDFIHPLLINKTPGKLLELMKGGIATEDLRLIRAIFLDAPYDVKVVSPFYCFLTELPDEAFKDFIDPLLIKKDPGKLIELITGGIVNQDSRLIETIFVNASDDGEFSSLLYRFLKVLKDETFHNFIHPFLIKKDPVKLLSLIKGGIATEHLRLIKTIFNACPNVEISLENGKKIAELAARYRDYDFITKQLQSHPVFEGKLRLCIPQAATNTPNAFINPKSQTRLRLYPFGNTFLKAVENALKPGKRASNRLC